MPDWLTRLGRDERGATAAEYALLVGLIATVIVASVATLGRAVSGFFTQFNSRFSQFSG